MKKIKGRLNEVLLAAVLLVLSLIIFSPLISRAEDPLDNWNGRNNPLSSGNWLYGITYGNHTFVAVSYDWRGPTGTIVTSPDGTSWTTALAVTPTGFFGVTHGNNTFVVVGIGGTILTSPDGTNWTSRNSGTTHDLYGVTYSNNTFVAVGDLGTIVTSPDGADWTARNSGTENWLWAVTYGNNAFVAVGGGGTILTSPDGTNWTTRNSRTTHDLYGVTYGNNTFVAVGDLGTIVTSPDGVNWTSRTSGTENLLWTVTYGNNTFVAVGGGGTMLTSSDGTIWTSRSSGTENWLMGVTYDNNTFITVGGAGTIIQSDPVAGISNPDISVSPASVNFGYVSVGSISRAQTFTVSNKGDAALLIGTITMSAAASDFTKENDNCSGQTIPPSGTCTFQALFSPVSSGTKSAAFSIPSNDPDQSVLNVPLRGRGIVKGDLNNDGNVSLTDALLALHVLTRNVPPALRADYAASGVDIDGDNKVGLIEPLFILQKIAGLRVIPDLCTSGGGSGTPAEQAACYLTLLAAPETRLSGWLGLYDALAVPVLQDGAPVGSTGDDPVGPHYWQVWYASGMDLPGRGITLSDAGMMMAKSISDGEAVDYGRLLLNDLRLAAGSSDPQVRLLGLFVRGRILRGPSHADILDPAVTPEMAVIDLPTLQFLEWIIMRSALFQDVSAISQASLLAEGLTLQLKRAPAVAISNLKCSDLSNDYTVWTNWLINKIGGGFQLPGMEKSLLVSVVARFKTKYLQSVESVIEKTNKVTGVLNVLTSAIGAGLQYLALSYDYSQSPLPLVRNKINNCYEGTCDGEPGVITLKVEYNLGEIPDGESLYLCYIGFLSNTVGVSINFPSQGPIPNTEIYIEPGEKIPELVLFDASQGSQTTYRRVNTDANGQANINILGRNKQGVPDTATPREERSSIIVSAQVEEAGINSMASMFFDAISVPFGGGTPATLSFLIGVLKTVHWKERELFIIVKDWTTDDITEPTVPTDLAAATVSSSQLNLSWSAATDDVGVTGYNIYRGGTYLKSTAGTAAADNGLAASTQYCYQITAFDAAKNESDRSSRVCAKTKNQDETRPTVIATSPAAGATNAARSSTIMVTFSKAMDPATITRDALTVSNGKTVLFAFYHAATRTAEFTLSTGLAADTEYTATISAGVMDSMGNALDSDYTWSFLTGEGPATLISIEVTPVNPSVSQGLTQLFAATGTYSDGTSQKLTSGIIWNSSNTAVAVVNTFGLATGIAGGTSTITATLGTITGSATLIVTATAPGLNWAQRPYPRPYPGYYNLSGVVWSGTQFVAVGADNWGFGEILTSSDGATWTAQSLGTRNFLSGVVWSGTQFVAVGGTSYSSVAFTSPDGVTWTSRIISGEVSSLSGVAWSGTQFVAVAKEGSRILTSPDGVTWAELLLSETTNYQLNGIAWSGTQFAVVGRWGTILTSSDGATWTKVMSGTTRPLDGVAWSGTQFVAVGDGTILTSPDGATWTEVTSGAINTNTDLIDVVWSGTQFLAVGEEGTIITSPDGATWTKVASGTTHRLYGVAWSGTQFVAVGEGGLILTSP